MKRILLFWLPCCLAAVASCSGGQTPVFTESTDIGSVSIPGTDSYNGGTDTYTLTGSGENLWNSKDACHFVWKKVTGDFLVEGKVSFEGEGKNSHRKIGFMLRESLDEDARYADIAIHGDGLTSLQYREETGGLTFEKVSPHTAGGATVIRLVRTGNRLSMRTGSDALPDTDDAALLLDLPEECYLGLFVCSHDDAVTETACFQDVRFTQEIPAEKGVARISIFTDHIGTIARQENISFAKAAELVRDMGYTGADTRVFQKPEEIASLDSLGFAHSSAITDIDFSQPDQTALEDRTLAFLRERNYPTLLVVTGLVPDEFTRAQRDEARGRIAAFAGRGAGEGYRMLVEDFDNPRSLCFNAEGLDSLFALTPSLGLVFDTGNFLYAGQDALSCMDHFLDRVGHVHLKDRTAPDDMTCVPAGTGCLPVAALIGTLDRNGYKGWFTVEQYGSGQMLEDTRTAYEKTLAALKAARE